MEGQQSCMYVDICVRYNFLFFNKMTKCHNDNLFYSTRLKEISNLKFIFLHWHFLIFLKLLIIINYFSMLRIMEYFRFLHIMNTLLYKDIHVLTARLIY